MWYTRQCNTRLALFWAPFFDETLAQKSYEKKTIACFYGGAQKSYRRRSILNQFIYSLHFKEFYQGWSYFSIIVTSVTWHDQLVQTYGKVCWSVEVSHRPKNQNKFKLHWRNKDLLLFDFWCLLLEFTSDWENSRMLSRLLHSSFYFTSFFQEPI